MYNSSLMAACAAALIGLGLATTTHAEEYMKRGASVDDYEQALDRVVERKRGLVTGRDKATGASSRPVRAGSTAQPAPRAAKPAAAGTAAAGTAAATLQPRPDDVYKPAADETDSGDGVSVYFGFGVAELNADAAAALARLGQALKAPRFDGMAWLIEGHTDAVGSPDYNQQLSEERAVAVRRFLLDCCGLSAEQLIAIGKGESEPYARDEPDASVNRRVRVRPLGG